MHPPPTHNIHLIWHNFTCVHIQLPFTSPATVNLLIVVLSLRVCVVDVEVVVFDGSGQFATCTIGRSLCLGRLERRIQFIEAFHKLIIETVSVAPRHTRNNLRVSQQRLPLPKPSWKASY